MSSGFDLSVAVGALATDTITINRAAGPGSYVNGNWVPSATTPITTAAVVTPFSAETTERLPEGERNGSRIEIYCAAPLLVEHRASSQAADLVTWKGKVYQVDALSDWSGHGYYRATATLVDPG